MSASSFARQQSVALGKGGSLRKFRSIYLGCLEGAFNAHVHGDHDLSGFLFGENYLTLSHIHLRRRGLTAKLRLQEKKERFFSLMFLPSFTMITILESLSRQVREEDPSYVSQLLPLSFSQSKFSRDWSCISLYSSLILRNHSFFLGSVT